MNTATTIDTSVTVTTALPCNFSFEIHAPDGSLINQYKSYTLDADVNGNFAAVRLITLNQPGTYSAGAYPIAGDPKSCTSFGEAKLNAVASADWPCTLNGFKRFYAGSGQFVCIPPIAAPADRRHATCANPAHKWVDFGFIYGCMATGVLRTYLDTVDAGG